MIKKIKTEKFEGLAVLVPEVYYCAEIESETEDNFFQLNYMLDNNDEESGFYDDPVVHSIDLPFNCSILGHATELTEEQCAEIVDSQNFQEDDGEWYEWFWNYESKIYNCSTPKEAFASLMQSLECYSANPYGEKEPEDISDLGAFTQMMRQKWKNWKQAQANTGTWVVIERLSQQ